MSATVIPFPLGRRRGFILKQAAWLATMSDRGLENTLWGTLMGQRDALLRKGCDPAIIEREVQALEVAIRSELSQWGRQA